MPRYAILLSPSANRVYGQHAPDLAAAEFAVVARSLRCEARLEGVTTIGGVEYLVVVAAALEDHDLEALSNLSGTFALFELRDVNETLRPVELRRSAAFGSDLITIQRYSGKTNEQFTHLLVNLAVAVSPAAQERRAAGLAVRLFDPVAGRGTTLNRGLMYGFDVAGMDVDDTDFDAYRHFLTTYLKDNGRSFKLDDAHVRKGPQAGSKRFTVRIEGRQRVEVVRDDAAHADRHFGAKSFDVLVGDLPYGVQHGSTAGGNLARAPGDLVAACAAAWRAVLRSGAGVALAWNNKTLKRDHLEGALADAGFTVLAPPRSFEHRVDRAITRDVVLAQT